LETSTSYLKRKETSYSNQYSLFEEIGVIGQAIRGIRRVQTDTKLKEIFTAPNLIANMPVQTRRRAALQETPSKADAGATKKSSAKSSPAKKLPVREKEEEEVPTPTKGTLKVFDDEDEDEAKAPLESSLDPAAETAQAVEDNEEEEEEDSDDEAPEAVSTTKVAEEIKKSAQAAQQAAKEYVQLLLVTNFSDQPCI
jgi:hypothetical protein